MNQPQRTIVRVFARRNADRSITAYAVHDGVREWSVTANTLEDVLSAAHTYCIHYGTPGLCVRKVATRVARSNQRRAQMTSRVRL